MASRGTGAKWWDGAAMRALDVLPKNAVSRAFGVLSEVRLPPPVQGVVNEGFAKLYGLNTAEAERSPREYASLNAFFTRHLKEGARQVQDRSPGALVSPVDGKLTQFGELRGGTLVQAKGREYRLVELLDSAAEAERFARGAYATIYLSPKDYHRIHTPCAGRAVKLSYIPGQLWPVNPLSVRNVERLFAVNERLIVYLETEELGRVAVIMVGATCVGKIGLAFDPMVSNQAWRRRQDRELFDEVVLDAGDELGVFQLGSTVILLVEREGFVWSDELVDGLAVTLGEVLGRLG